MGQHPEQGWKHTEGLHPLQQAFIESGAIQCGYCTPAQILAASNLLAHNSNPTEEEVRQALSGVLCRCTGYLKPVQAVLRAAAVLRGEVAPSSAPGALPVTLPDLPEPPGEDSLEPQMPHTLTRSSPKVVLTSAPASLQTVGKSEIKVDAVKLAQGKPAFTADLEMRGMLVARLLHSPHAHARITRIDASRARALPGVAAVLTWQDLPRVAYSTAGQSDPMPGPLDTFSLDHKVRFVGDRVAFVAAETEEIAEQALRLIEVEYELLPILLDPTQAMQPDAPILHDEPEYVNFADSDPSRNLAAEIRIDIGDVEKGFAEADRIFEAEYEVPKVQQAHIEPHVVRDLLGRGRPVGDPHQHAGALPCAPHPGAGAGAAGQAYPRDQAAHRRRLWRQAGSADRRCGRPPDDCHGAPGDLRVHPRARVHRGPLAPSRCACG